jgi:hypothetical protein
MLGKSDSLLKYSSWAKRIGVLLVEARYKLRYTTYRLYKGPQGHFLWQSQVNFHFHENEDLTYNLAVFVLNLIQIISFSNLNPVFKL